MIEEWLLVGTSETDRSRIRHLLDRPPPPDPRAAATTPTGSTPRAQRGTGISLAEAQRMARDAAEWDRSMGAG